jgi:ribosomal-protein-alanine N-acetyltransferase
MTATPTIRDCRLEDIPAVLDLWKQAGAIPSLTDTADDLRRALTEAPACVLLAEADARLIGSIIGASDGWRGNIYRLAVHPQYRRHGVARALVSQVEKWFSARKVKRITALVAKEHTWATGFWNAVGYKWDQRIVRHVRTLAGDVPSLSPKQVASEKIVVSEQVHLSDFRPSDKAALVQHLKEKEIYDRTLRIPYPYTEADAEFWFGLEANIAREHGRHVNWAIRNQNDHLIGGIGFDGLTIGKSHLAEIGYWLAKPYWGRGIMTAVVRTLCDFALANFGLGKIRAHVFADNAASAKVLAKCGFREEGYLRRHYLKDGRYLDARLFALLKE